MRDYKTDERVCDKCSKSSRNILWGKGKDTVETEIRLNYNLCNGNWILDKEYIVDLCPECFNDILLPYLKSIGIKVREELKQEINPDKIIR